MVKVVAHDQWFTDMFFNFSIGSYIKLYTKNSGNTNN